MVIEAGDLFYGAVVAGDSAMEFMLFYGPLDMVGILLLVSLVTPLLEGVRMIKSSQLLVPSSNTYG